MTKYLLDTNVVSELAKPESASLIGPWFKQQALAALYVSVITLGELHRGLYLAPAHSKRRAMLEDWYKARLLPTFESRILDVTQPVAEIWGELTAAAKSSGKTLPNPDSLIAATAIAHGPTMVTRNVRDFARTGVDIVNPWEL